MELESWSGGAETEGQPNYTQPCVPTQMLRTEMLSHLPIFSVGTFIGGTGTELVRALLFATKKSAV